LVEFSDHNLERCLYLTHERRIPTVPDDVASQYLAELEVLLRNPHVTNLIFLHPPSLTAEEVIEKAREYCPFVL
jgi:hypothetical protein